LGESPVSHAGFLSKLEKRRICLVIPQDLLEILVCPVCRKPLVLKDEAHSLKCAACRRVYPVRDDIPILLVDEAVTDPS
jgi:uncharacterized protein